MDRVSKFLSKISRQERERIMPIIANIVLGVLTHLDCKKLKGTHDEYRVRTGSIRIKFIKTPGGNVITSIGRRDDTTYR